MEVSGPQDLGHNEVVMVSEESPPNGSSADRPRRHYPRWVNQLLVPVTIAVVGTLLVTALTPLGESLRELLFPTRAAVTGSVLFSGQPVVGAGLRLDGVDAGATGGDGRFLLVSVGRGEHRLHVEMTGGKPLDHAFAVGKGETRLDLDAIEIEPLVRLGYVASVSPLVGALDVEYDLTLWIDADDPSVLNRIVSIAYTLPAPLPPDPVAGGAPQQSFCYREAGRLAFGDLFPVGGAFGVAAAFVDLGDGQPFQITAPPGESLPSPTVNCQVHEPDSRPEPEQTPPGPGPLPPPPGPSPSQPQPMVSIPDLGGMPAEEAQTRLEELGLAVDVVRQPSDGTPGTVIGTDPAVGQTVAKGSTVVLLVVETFVTVPNVVCATEADATEKLEAQGLHVLVRDSDEPPSSDLCIGRVVSQDPPAGQQVPAGSTVTIYVHRS
jgi:hypothetical protein